MLVCVPRGKGSPSHKPGVALARASRRIASPGILFIVVVLVSFARFSDAADLATATEAYRTGKYAECIAAATELVTQNEYHEPAWVLKIQSELETGKYADASKSL